MREQGTAGLTLRGVARRLNLTAPAIYNYYPRWEDLITALIVDAFNALADFVEQSVQPDVTTYQQLVAGMLAYREWAVAHPTDFQLIYGNPIPGYEAPAEVTVPLARRPLEHFGQLMQRAALAGELTLPEEYAAPPPQVAEFLAGFLPVADISMTPALFYVLMIGWTRIHGLVMLELFDHTPPVLGDPAAAYAHEVWAFLHRLGMGANKA